MFFIKYPSASDHFTYFNNFFHYIFFVSNSFSFRWGNKITFCERKSQSFATMTITVIVSLSCFRTTCQHSIFWKSLTNVSESSVDEA
jgi:hypothetical protein